MKVEVWFSFAVEMTIKQEDIEDISLLARKGRPLLLDRITSDSIAECIEDVTILDDKISQKNEQESNK